MTKKITVYDIAKEAKVSIATISRAVNPETRKKVAPETLQLIDELVKKYDYVPNLAAKNLVRACYKTIGVIFPHHAGIFSEDYYHRVLCGISDSLLDAKYGFKMIMLKGEKPKWDKYNFKSAEGVDGLIITHWKAFFSDKSVLEKMTVPCVVINDPEENVPAHFLSGNHEQGGRLAAEHLYSCGHRNIAVFTGPADSTDSRLRMKGFESFLREKGVSLNPDHILCADFQEEKAAGIAEIFLKMRPDVTAIFCLNDAMAFGVLKKMKELGISCPDQISVIGYDGDKRGETCEPPLTTVDVPLYELAKEGAMQLVRFLDDKSLYKKPDDFFGIQTLLPVSLVERKSVRSI